MPIESSAVHFHYDHKIDISEQRDVLVSYDNSAESKHSVDCESSDECTDSEDETDHPMECHHCYCMHFDSVQTRSSAFSIYFNVKTHYMAAVHLYLDEPVSNLIKPPEAEISLSYLPLV